MTKIDFANDIWKVPCKDKSLSESDHTFDFTHMVPESLKNQFKEYFFAGLKREFIEASSLHVYSYSLIRFTGFLKETNLRVIYFSDLTSEIIDRYIYYLKSTCNSSSTMVLSYTALKQSVRYGQNLRLELYPKCEIFPQETTRLFGHEDTLKTRLFSDDVAVQIENALNTCEDIYLKTMIMIAYETGLRLSEILNIEEGSLLKDFAGTPLLFTDSFKSNEERCVPISDECARQIELLEDYTKNFRFEKKIFSVKYRSKPGSHIQFRSTIRKKLSKFLVENNIVDESGEIAHVIFHGFRHHVGTTYLNSGASADETKLVLGHKSLHSTNLYAKMKPKTLINACKKAGLIGISEGDLDDDLIAQEVILEKQKIIEGALPDGVCLKAFEGDNHCEKFNVCLMCSKFRTTVDDLPTHKQHLYRLRTDKNSYMAEMSIGNIEYVEKIDLALETIIECLEAIKSE